MYDLKKWFLMPLSSEGQTLNGQRYGRDTHHLEGMNVTNNSKVYAYHTDTGKRMVFTKTPKGFPWDGKDYDERFVYDTFTELDWTSPTDMKQMAVPIPMCPRYWNGDPGMFQFSKNALYYEYVNCAPRKSGDVGPVYYKLQGPFRKDFQGDINVQDCILLTYYWSDMKHRERLFLTPTFGWVDWDHSILQSFSTNIADYVIDAAVTHNRLVPGTIAPNVPCLKGQL